MINITGNKLAKQDVLDPALGAWMANLVLFPIGLFFLRQARVDARLFDMDFYNVAIIKLRQYFKKNKKAAKATQSTA